MLWLRLIYTRLYGLPRKNRIEQEIDDEMRFHLRIRTQENMERGMRPEEPDWLLFSSFLDKPDNRKPRDAPENGAVVTFSLE